MRILCEKTVTTTASKEAIWAIWQIVDLWPTWDSHMVWAKLDGEFKVGQRGQLKPEKGPVVSFVIASCVPLESFVSFSRLPLATLEVGHWVVDLGDRRQVTHRISIRGPLGFLFAKLLGKQFADSLEIALPNLVAKAEV